MDLTAEQSALEDALRSLAIEEILPTAREADRNAEFPEAVWDNLAELDLTGLTVPEAYGGVEADPITYRLVNEWIAYGSLAVATALSVHCLATTCLSTFANEDLKKQWLPDMADGRPVGAFALSEPHAGSNPAALSTEARREGDEYVITGEKQWITNGERAGVIVLFAKTDREKPDTITQFLVPADVDGLTVGDPEDKLGLRASDTTTLTFDGVRIPAEYRLTPVGDGLSAALSVLTDGRIGIAAQSVGLSQCAVDHTVEYCRDRVQFDRPIAERQTVRHTLAAMATKTQAARQLTRYAARVRDTTDQTNPSDVKQAASMAKYFASEVAMFVTNEAVQLHGGYGYVSEYPVERLYRDAKITEIYEGATEIQKSVIADTLLERTHT